jgi:hypothetical protein
MFHFLDMIQVNCAHNIKRLQDINHVTAASTQMLMTAKFMKSQDELTLT